MYMDRTPTNTEFLEKVLGFCLVVFSIISFIFSLTFSYTTGHPTAQKILLPVATISLIFGWSCILRKPHESVNWQPILIITGLTIGVVISGRSEGLLFAGILGIISALFLLPFSVFTILGSWSTWRNAEGATNGKRSFVPVELHAGVIRPANGNYKQKFREAEEIFDNAHFKNDTPFLRPAERAPNEWRFGRDGAPDLAMDQLNFSLHYQIRRQWDIFVLMVNALPEEPEQPAVIVITGSDLGKMTVNAKGIGLQMADFDGEIPASSIRAYVCYRW